MQDNKIIILDGENLSLSDMVRVAREGYMVFLSDKAVENIRYSRKIVDEIVEDEKVVYGVTTGFGEFCNISISKDETKQLQENLIRSHACGFGNPLPTDVVRAIMLNRVNALCKGYSGVRLSTLEVLLKMINRRVHPVIPEKGSLGASGDLAPLAHMVLVMLGLGKAEYNGQIMDGKEAMKKAGIETVHLSAKEGLALINGTQVLTSIGALAVYDATKLLKLSDIAAALTIEALRGIRDAFDERIHLIRAHEGQIKTAKNILNLIDGSSYATNQGELRVQDAYSLRCVPQVHGASKDTVDYVRKKVEIEINSVTDNPIITRQKDVISGGNFHGEVMAQPFDFLAIGVAEIANISERRLERLINHQLNDLPAFLAKHGGLNSGYMITQYAAASLVSENKVLSHPASVDSIPSSANQEDIVSMGTIAARKAKEIVENTQRVLATEMMAACQAIDFRKDSGFELGQGTKIAYEKIRENVKFIEMDKDIQMYEELDRMTEMIKDSTILDAVEKKINLEV